jgi:hypothetical protein
MEEPSILPAVKFRAAGDHEPTPDLQHPVFDNFTLPLLFSPMWQNNFGELSVLVTTKHIANMSKRFPTVQVW